MYWCCTVFVRRAIACSWNGARETFIHGIVTFRPRDKPKSSANKALQDTDVALIRLFQRLPEIDQIEFHVLKPLPPDEVILTGVVDREKVLDPERSPSLRMRLKMLGVHYEMADSHLVPLPYRAWTLIFKKRGGV
jgi:hypothetical protein